MDSNRVECAGGVVVNAKGEIIVVSQHGLSWSLPKGHLDPGETAFDAAVREIAEETGITKLTFIRELGSYERYRTGLNQDEDMSELKHITMFLFSTTEEKFQPMSAIEHPEVRWVHVDEAIQLLTHPKDKEFLASSKAFL